MALRHVRSFPNSGRLSVGWYVRFVPLAEVAEVAATVLSRYVFVPQKPTIVDVAVPALSSCNS